MKRVLFISVILLLAQNIFACSASFTSTMAPQNNNLLRVIFANTCSPLTAPFGQTIRFIYRYGDGTSDSMFYNGGSSHIYASTGTYTAKIIMQVIDSPNFTNVHCTDSSTGTVTVSYLTCATLFDTSYGSGFSVTLTANNPAATSGMSYSWNFGDGNTGTGSPITHTYAAGGSYSAYLTATSSLPCTYTNNENIIFSNRIEGALRYDTTSCFVSNTAYKVWLITYNTTTQILAAVDSLIIPFHPQYGAYNYYTFYNEPAGTYRVKAMITNGPTSGNGPLPTYGTDSLHWNNADSIIYIGAGTIGSQNVHLQCGLVTGGPGFIAGNVTLGANKGTKVTNGPAGVEILLSEASGIPIAYSITDANGHFSFSNLPVATGAGSTYKLYPEVLGYQNTPWYVTLTTASPSDTTSSVHISTNHRTVGPTATSNIIRPSNDIVVFPNPTTGLLNASCGEIAHAIISDMIGRTILETDIKQGNTQLNLSNLVPGIYFINIKSADINYSNKIILQR